MTVWMVLGAIVLLVFLAGLVRVGGIAEYSAQGVRVDVRLGAFHIHVFPFKRKDKAKKKKRKKKRKPARDPSAGRQDGVQNRNAAQEPEPGQEQAAAQERKRQAENEKERQRTGKSGSGGPVELLRRYLPLLSEAGGALLRRIRIDTLFLDYTAAGSDPAQTAMSYGLAQMAAGIILPVLERGFDIKERRFRAGVDFEADKPSVYLKAAFSARIGQLFSFAVIFGIKFLRAYLRGKKAAGARKG